MGPAAKLLLMSSQYISLWFEEEFPLNWSAIWEYLSNLFSYLQCPLPLLWKAFTAIMLHQMQDEPLSLFLEPLFSTSSHFYESARPLWIRTNPVVSKTGGSEWNTDRLMASYNPPPLPGRHLCWRRHNDIYPPRKKSAARNISEIKLQVRLSR